MRKLTVDLRQAGIDAIVDWFDLEPGQDISAFMANNIVKSDRVILVCTDSYVNKADAGIGGVGYERLIVTAEIVQSIDTKKFLPIVRNNPTGRTPLSLGNRKYISFQEDASYDSSLEAVIRAIHQTPLFVRPEVGNNPYINGTAQSSNDVFLATSSQQDWFEKNQAIGTQGLKNIGLKGSMEVFFKPQEKINKSQAELLRSVQSSNIHTFGWPIGIVLDNRDEFRPRPTSEGIFAEVSVSRDEMLGAKSYDYWSAHKNGVFYLIQGLFEDQRTSGKIFADSRIARVTESLLFCANLYERLGVNSDSLLSIRIVHNGLAERELTTASPNRMVTPARTTEDVSEAELSTTIEELRGSLVDKVTEVLQPMFMLFDFKQFNQQVYSKSSAK